jgi:GNAT superfamily N-acetyltransferase
LNGRELRAASYICTVPTETITRLEMTSLNQLVPGRPAPARLELVEARPDDAALLRSTWVRIGEPHGWTERIGWSDAQWESELAQTGVTAWIARVGDEVAGFVEFEAAADGDVGIVFFGLVPEFVGQGLGGDFLTRATELAWRLTSPNGSPARRVWLQTSSRDHPSALPNYEARGFRIFERETRDVAN